MNRDKLVVYGLFAIIALCAGIVAWIGALAVACIGWAFT